ncbi:MAG: ABC transporter permease [Chloroflexi bacterium]|nr:ABC transporter permease [Chloroflexota bacterium]
MAQRPRAGDLPAQASTAQLRRFAKRLAPWAPVIVLVLLCLTLGLLNPRFLSADNFVRLARSASIPLVLALGGTFIIILGSIDLSVEGVIALTAVALSMTVTNDRTDLSLGILGIVIALGLGGLMGFINGFIHVRLRIPSFMVTLGMWFIGLGVATILTQGIAIRVQDPMVRGLVLERFLGFPYMVWVALIALAVAYVIQRYTRIGRYMYAIGGGEDIAKLSGIPINRQKIIMFTLAGLFYALGGIMAGAQLGQSNALIGQGRLFMTITAIVVGGTALSGGVGGVGNTFIGVLIVAVLDNGMVLLGVSPYVQQAVQGILIIIAVAISLDRSRLRVVK